MVGAIGTSSSLSFQSFLFNAGNPMAQTSDGALTVISCTVDITITSDPTGLQIEVDGTPVITPQTYSWNPGDNHTLNALSPQSGGTGIQFVYNSWSNGGAQSQTLTVPGSPTTYTASYDTEYELGNGQEKITLMKGFWDRDFQIIGHYFESPIFS